MTDPSEFPDPSDVAAAVARGAEGDGAGVLNDTLMEAVMDAEQYQRDVQDVAVTLDAVADNQGLLPAAIQQEVREAQTRLQAVSIWLNDYQGALRAEWEEARR